jgi:hypothetical protein
MAITTSSSTSVKARRRNSFTRNINHFLSKKGTKETRTTKG